MINEPFFSIVTTKGIDKPEDLRGKKIGISTFGSATDFALRLALKKWNIKADSEVTILQMRGVPEIMPAMVSGALHGGVMSPPTNMIAIRAGFKELAYLPQAAFPFNTRAGDQQKIFGAQPRHRVESLARLSGGVERIKADKAFTRRRWRNT